MTRHRGARRAGPSSSVVVAVLGRADQPVGGAEGLGQRERGGHVLALDGPHRVHEQALVVGHVERRAGGRAVAGRLVDVEAVVDRGRRRCPRSAISRFGEPVDGDVPPRRVVGRQLGDVRPLRLAATADRGGAAPPGGRAGRAATARAAGRFSGIVQRFSTTTRSAPASAASSSAGVGGVEAPDGQARAAGGRPDRRRRPCAPSSPGRASTRAQVGGDHRDAVVTSEAERHEGDVGHGGTLPTGAALADRARAAARGGLAGRRRPAASASPTPPPTRGSGCGTAASTPSCGPTSATSAPSSSCAPRCRPQDDDGFVPHLRYGDGPLPARGALGPPRRVDHHPAADVRPRRRRARPPRPAARRRASSSGRERGPAVPPASAGAGAPAGLVELCHPWESGCDDSPRWDDAVPGGWTSDGWYAMKGELVAAIERHRPGLPLHNPAFAVGSVGFSALVAWNALELAR